MSATLAEINTQLLGAFGIDGTASGADGTSAPAVAETFDNQNFAPLQLTNLRLSPESFGGDGGSGADGMSGSDETAGGVAGSGGNGGAADVTLQNDSVGDAADVYDSDFELSVYAAAGLGGGGGIGSIGGPGGDGGSGGDAAAQIATFTSAASGGTALSLVAAAALGHYGSYGGANSGGEGGPGGNGGAGGGAIAALTGSSLADSTNVEITVTASAGMGGGGGGPGLGNGQVDGAGGNGASGGAASATVSGDDFTSPFVEIQLGALGGAGGPGGIDGYAGGARPAGPSGTIGANGTELLVLADDTVNVAAIASPADQLILILKEGESGTTGSSYVPLNGAAGGNLVFAGNRFDGDGSSNLALELAGGGATIDTLADTISIGGSAGNRLTGFDSFSLDDDETFVVGAGSYTVSVEDADTIELTPMSDSVIIYGADANNLLLDYQEFAGLTLAQLQSDTSTSGGNTFVNIPGGGQVELFAYTGLTETNFAITPACYVRGTRIATLRGPVAVERLAAGDRVMTADGGSRPVVWLGYRRVDATAHPEPASIWPIRVAAHAFAHGLPSRDLWLSPDHSVAVNGALVQISRLQNGATIRQVECASVEYWHVELDAHDVIFAESLPAESYLDSGNRAAFSNGGAFVALHPDFRPRHWTQTCLPIAFGGPVVQRSKAALLSRAARLGYALGNHGDLHIIADGQRFDPIQATEARFGFCLPAGRRGIVLHSRSFVPAHVDPASPDWRVLGVCVGWMAVDGVTIALDDDASLNAGWHAYEPMSTGSGWRWTRGRTPLPTGTRFVVLDLASPGFYWAEHEVPPVIAHRSVRG